MIKGAIAEISDNAERRSFYYTTLFVVFFHAAALYWFGVPRDTKVSFQPKNRVIVQTVKLDNFAAEISTTPKTAAKNIDQARSAPSEPSKSKQIKEEKFKAKPKEIADALPRKASPPKIKEQAKPAPKQYNTKPAAQKEKNSAKAAQAVGISEATKKKQALIEAAKAAVSKVKNSESKNSPLAEIKSSSFTPLPLVSSSNNGSAEVLGARRMTYAEEIASILKFFLHLPEYGEVDITLTLTSHGKVVDLLIVKSQNKANSSYVQANVKTIEFPPFGKNFPGENTRTFSIKLSMDTL